MATIEPKAMPPAVRVPGLLAVREYVGQAEDAAVMLLEIRAYSEGCLLEFVVASRGAVDGSPRFDVDITEPAETERIVSGLDDPVSGGTRLWISPLPPTAPFVLVTNWPELGIDGQRSTLDGGAIRQAAWESFPLLPA
ncbi:MAG TPA: hypothetical protein VGH99_18235 [Pseudonocardia sp.]